VKLQLKEEDLPPLTGSALLDPWRLRLRQELRGELVQPRRTGATRSEQVLWAELGQRNEQWRREYATGPYRLDFYLPEVKLAVEVDGGSHWGGLAAQRDAVRDQWHADRGVRTLRVTDREVLQDLAAVLDMIDRECEVRRLAHELDLPVQGLPDEVVELRTAAPVVEAELIRLAAACETILPDFGGERSFWKLPRPW
jgi:very-short-patch-repair endonuclease